MNIVLWIIAGLLAAAFLAAGMMKVTQPKPKLAANMGWVEDFSDTSVKLIGLAEVIGAVGLILPAATGVATILTPLAATGLAATMTGAVIVHIRRGENGQIAPATVLLVLSALVAALRFGPYAF